MLDRELRENLPHAPGETWNAVTIARPTQLIMKSMTLQSFAIHVRC